MSRSASTRSRRRSATSRPESCAPSRWRRRARSAALPDVPTAQEAGVPGFEAVLYYGIAAPAGTPRPIVERINKEMRAIITSDEISKRIVADGGDPAPATPEEYAAQIERDEAKWSDLIKKIGLVIN